MINNMFSQKYKDDVVEDLFNSMEQLDRIEFQNRLIQQNQSRNLSKIIQSTFMIANLISMSFLVYFASAFSHLLSLGFYSEIHRQAGLLFVFLTIISGVAFFFSFIQSISQSDRTKKDNDEQLDFILDNK